MNEAARTLPSSQNVGGAPSAGYDDLAESFDNAIQACAALASKLAFEDEHEANVVDRLCVNLKNIKLKRDKRKEEADRMNQATQLRSQLP